jgi:hypothetical protein
VSHANALSVLLAGVLLAGACARAYAPPGGETDETPPRLVSTTPEPLSVVAPSNDPVIFRFDERLSERGFSEALIVVSPLDSAVRVERARTEVRVRIDGGWRADRVYRIVLLPGLRDLFGNTRDTPIELVFSTGPPVPNTAIAGMVLDRITGRAAANPVVDAVRRADSVRYTAVADTGGFFALRHLPLGVYDLRAYADANRNRRRDPLEPVDSSRVASLAQDADTVPHIFHVLAPDTTPPTLTRASAVDSMHVRVVIDDYVSDTAAAGAAAQVLLLPDSTPYAQSVSGLLEPVFAREQRAAGISRDTLRADTAATDPVAADPAVVEPPLAEDARPGAILPAREIIFRLDRALTPGLSYIITVRGLSNLWRLVGGGSAEFEVAAPPPPPPAADDTARASLQR